MIKRLPSEGRSPARCSAPLELSKHKFSKDALLNMAILLAAGGLPDGWLSTANTFRSLRELDLSDNQLGKDKDGNDFGANAWCLNGRTDDSGWCPTTVVKSRAARLENLDLSENGLVGECSLKSRSIVVCKVHFWGAFRGGLQ